MLKETRQKAGMSQIALSAKSGVPVGTVCRIEKGVRINQVTAQKLADALSVDVRALFANFDQLRKY